MTQRKQRGKPPVREQFYALLLHLYPGAHHREYGPLMLQAFRDHYRETREAHGRMKRKAS